VANSLTEPRLRRDAQRNLDAILGAAQAAFSECGLDVGVEEIARRAGVGMGTLYRRFPHKDDLIAAIFEQRLGELAVTAEMALEDPKPWSGLVRFLEAVAELQAANRGFKDILAHTLRREGALTPARRRIRSLNAKLVERAQKAGVLRDDVTAEDISVLLMSMCAVVETTSETAPDFWRRFLAISIDGLRTGQKREPLPHPPLSAKQLDKAMQSWRTPR
jgi:AcrR family transcriptional regulator